MEDIGRYTRADWLKFDLHIIHGRPLYLAMAKILCVDDEPHVVTLKCAILEAAGHQVTPSTSARDAIDKLMDIASNDPDRDLRKQAIFWLGQSHDPRVQKFLLDLINR